ncbi:hypothetical protein TVNIR_2159 [Thioalkalivibrio nitratireducens DSM 14787]|uniref:Uncharacterized protein n=1 Tax=Thioalkalivibrio nitratireducens (strain DSM 14787 / UNIQEM 213 / ALEN2) TaxID=1255043 RepID=L0DXW6_THIND|nr:hypothetical protein TVNIR_2159 [Thioalkalivibrio nitratireducens DSM 14787]
MPIVCQARRVIVTRSGPSCWAVNARLFQYIQRQSLANK